MTSLKDIADSQLGEFAQDTILDGLLYPKGSAVLFKDQPNLMEAGAGAAALAEILAEANQTLRQETQDRTDRVLADMDLQDKLNAARSALVAALKLLDEIAEGK